MSLRTVYVALFLAGLAGGTIYDCPQTAEPLQAGPYRVLEADFPVHTFLGDGALSPWNVVLEARRRGLDALAITNHNQVFAARLARRFARAAGGPIVLVGQEITAPGWHLIGAGLERAVDWRQPAAAAIAEVQRQGGVAIAAHPVKVFWPAFTDEVVAALDGAERMHPLVYAVPDERDDLPLFWDRARRVNPRLAAIGSSDYHAFDQLGVCRTYVFVTEAGEAGVLDAVRRGRTVVFDPDGVPVGDPELIELLGDRIEPGRRHLVVEPPSPADFAARTCAWLGLAGLVFGRRDRSSSRVDDPPEFAARNR